MLAEMGAYGEDMRPHGVVGRRLPRGGVVRGKFWLPDASDRGSRLAAEPGPPANPLEPKTYEVASNIINDITSMFPDGFTTPALTRTGRWCSGRTLDVEVNVSASAIPLATTVLQTWNNGANNTKLIVQAGTAPSSPRPPSYLDCGHGDFVGNNSEYDDPRSDFDTKGGLVRAVQDVAAVYDYDIAYGLTAEEGKLVIGGEVALWTEQADSTVLTQGSGCGRRPWRRRCGQATATRPAGSVDGMLYYPMRSCAFFKAGLSLDPSAK
ncbi:hypothetical protein ZWY2020_024395 [Hordeum vulgare]|nr:hypothetical protein ZWY2020_024395 [Hordeum vulgare]